MGFFGYMLLARIDQPLSELPCVVAIGEPCAEVVQGGGWRLGQIHDADVSETGTLAHALVQETSAPALAMYVTDSDSAVASCDSPLGERHTFLLNPQAALAMYMPWDPPPPPVPTEQETVRALMRWASEATLPADPHRLAAALPLSPGPFAEGIDALVAALGVPSVDAPESPSSSS